eukprot:g18753.t1
MLDFIGAFGAAYISFMTSSRCFLSCQVFLYFWDNRDGADFSGWWFGDQVGGTQVWARNPSPGPLPPRTGWKVDQAEKAANATIAKVKAALAGDSPPEDELSELQITLQKQQMTLSECLKSTTQEVNEFRKLGPNGKDGVAELSKLLPKVRQLQASLIEQLNKLKAALGPAAQKESKENEAKNTKELEEALPAVKDLTSVAEAR